MWVAVNKEDDRAYAGACDHGAQFDWLWAAALDAAPRLNGKVVSEGLLREAIKWLEVHAPACSVEQEVANELRTMLDEGREIGDA